MLKSPQQSALLLDALQRNDFKTFSAIFEANNWPIDSTCWDYHILLYAIKQKRKQFVNYLLNKGCRVYIEPGILTPLHFAVSNAGWKGVIVRLVSLKCPLDAKYAQGKGETAIHYAFYNRISCDTIDLLLRLYLDNHNPIENVTNDDGLSFLHIACSRDNVSVVEKFIQANPAAVNLSDKRSLSTPLHIAVEHRRYSIAEYLLRNKADMYVQNYKKWTPLHLALKLRDVEMINTILENDGLKENILIKFGLSHFMAACAGGNESIVKEYLQLVEVRSRITRKDFVNGKVENLVEFKHYTPLHIAVDFEHPCIVKLLLQNEANCCAIATTGLTPHSLAKKKGHDLICNLLTEYCKNCRDTMANQLANIVNIPNVTVTLVQLPPKDPASKPLRRILPALPPPPKRSRAEPCIGVPICDVNEQLRINGVTVTKDTTLKKPQSESSVQRQLQKALEQNNVDEFLSILKTKGCPKNAEFNLLTTAIKLERKRMVLALLDGNCRVHKSVVSANSCARTPLHMVATKVGWTDVVERLLDKGCRADDEDSKGDTPLHLAFHAGNVESTVDALLKSHIAVGNENVNKKHHGFLHIACSRPSLEVVRRLVEANHVINIPTSDSKNTPLHFAVANKRYEIAVYLIHKGANIYIQNANGSTALHVALELKDVQMIDLLLAYDTLKKDVVNRFGATHFMAACAGTNHRFTREYLWYGETQYQMSPYSMISTQVKNYSNNQISGYTPLHFASYFGRVNTVDLLLSFGADCCLVAANGFNCHALAIKPGIQQNVHRILQEHCNVVKSCRETRAQDPDFGIWGEKYEWDLLLERTRAIKSLRRNLQNFKSMSFSDEFIDIDE